MDPIPRERMGNATSLFSLMRNLGGSVGIAVTGTLLARQQHAFAAVLGEHVTPYSDVARRTFEGLRGSLLAAGVDPVTATQKAYATMSGLIQRQAAMVSFVELFRLLGAVFLVLLPLVLLMRRPSGGKGPAAAH